MVFVGCCFLLCIERRCCVCKRNRAAKFCLQDLRGATRRRTFARPRVSTSVFQTFVGSRLIHSTTSTGFIGVVLPRAHHCSCGSALQLVGLLTTFSVATARVENQQLPQLSPNDSCPGQRTFYRTERLHYPCTYTRLCVYSRLEFLATHIAFCARCMHDKLNLNTITLPRNSKVYLPVSQRHHCSYQKENWTPSS